MKNPISLLLLAGAISVTGCSAVNHYAAKIKDSARVLVGSSVTFIEPAPQQAITPYSALQLKATGGAAADQVSTALEAKLRELSLGGGKYFNQIAKANEPLTSDQAAQIEIAVRNANVTSASGHEQRFECPGSGYVKKCSQEEARHYTVSCITKTATIDAAMTSADVKTRKTIFTLPKIVTATSKQCSNEQYTTLKSDAELLSEASNDLAKQLYETITPALVKKPLELYEDDKLLDEFGNGKLKAAYAQAKSGDTQSALATYYEFINSGKRTANILFNAAFLEHSLGHFATANGLYQQALSMSPEDAGLIQKYHAMTGEWLMRGIKNSSRI